MNANQLLKRLQDAKNEEEQTMVLSEVTTYLCIGGANFIVSFPVASYLPLLKPILESYVNENEKGEEQVKQEDLKELHILVARGLAMMAQHVPRAIKHVAKLTGIILKGINKLQKADQNRQTKEMMEEMMKILEMIALQETHQILKNENAMKSLQKLIKQGKAIMIVANIIRKGEDIKQIEEMIDQCVNLLQKSIEDEQNMSTKTIETLLKECIAPYMTRFPKQAGQYLGAKKLVGILIKLYGTQHQNEEQTVLNLIYLLAKEDENVATRILKQDKIIGRMLIPHYLLPLKAIEKEQWDISQKIDQFIGTAATEKAMELCMRILTLILPPLKDNQCVQTKIEPFYEWYWEDDYHNFYPFDLNGSKILEKALEDGQTEVDVLGGRYVVNVKTFKQYNKSTKLMRNVRRSNLPTSFERTHIVYNNDSFIETQSLDDNIIQREPYPISIEDNELKVTLIDTILPIFVNIWDRFDHQESAQEDIAQCVARIITIIEENIRKMNFKRGFLKMIMKMITHQNIVIVTNGLYIIDQLKEVATCQSFFIHEKIKSVLSSVRYQQAKILQKQFTATTTKRTESEKKIYSLCEAMDRGEEIELSQLIHVSHEKVSVIHLIESDFVTKFLKYLHGDKDKLVKLARIFRNDRSILSNMITLLNEAINQLETFTPVNDHGSKMTTGWGLKSDLDQFKTLIKVTVQPTHPHELKLLQLDGIQKRQQATYDQAKARYDQQMKQKEVAIEKAKKDNKPIPTTYDHIVPPKKETSMNFQFNVLLTMAAIQQYLETQFALDTSRYMIVLSYKGLTTNPHETLFELLMKDKTPDGWLDVWSEKATLAFIVKPIEYRAEQAREVYKSFRTTYSLVENPDYFTQYPRFSTTCLSKKPIEAYLCLMRLLYYISEEHAALEASSSASSPVMEGPLIAQHHFENRQLTSKFSHQLCSLQSIFAVLANKMPQWSDLLCQHYGFLFSFESRKNYFWFKTFGILRMVTRYIQEGTTNVHRADVQRQSRQQLDRDQLVSQAIPIFEKEAVWHSKLDFEFTGESGFGTGPTLEAYTQISQSLLNRSLSLFRHFGEKDSEFVYAPKGLFLEQTHRISSLKNFFFLGLFMGKAVEDGCLLDLAFSPVFYRLLLGRKISISDLKLFEDTSLYAALRSLSSIQSRYEAFLQHQSRSSKTKKRRLHDRLLQIASTSTTLKSEYDRLSQSIEDLFLTFEFQGIPLINGGEDKDVTIANWPMFYSSLTRTVLNDSVREPFSHVLFGLHTLFPPTHLRFFSASELHQLFCGVPTLWESTVDIKPHLLFSNGYTLNSPQIGWLIKFMCELNRDEQSHFIEFCTGCRLLPFGGLKALSPLLTIVLAPGGDNSLPTCNTCFHYLKLPAYSSFDVLSSSLKTAILHGRGRFDLS